LIAESFPIAVYLEKTFPSPEYPSIFPPSAPESACSLTQNQVNFTPAFLTITSHLVRGIHSLLIPGPGADYFKTSREKQFGKFEDLPEKINSKTVKTMYLPFHRNLKAYGPYLGGAELSYNDFIFLSMCLWIKAASPAEAFDEFLDTVNDGVVRKWYKFVEVWAGEDQGWAKLEHPKPAKF
jgi:glutathione S-transferase